MKLEQFALLSLDIMSIGSYIVFPVEKNHVSPINHFLNRAITAATVAQYRGCCTDVGYKEIVLIYH